MRRGVPAVLACPMKGAMPDYDPSQIPPDGAAVLRNILANGGFARSRYGSSLFLDDSNTRKIVDLFNLTWPDDSFEALRCKRDGIDRVNTTPAWAAIAGATWTGTDSDRFWAVVVPFASDAKGRIAVCNGVDRIRIWAGGAGTFSDYPTSGEPTSARFGIVGDDNRLVVAGTREGGVLQNQRVRWTVIALANGGNTDWTATGSGALDLRNDRHPITGLWKQQGRIFVGKSRAVCVLDPTGISTDAYGYSTLQTNGDGLFAPRAIAQFGNTVIFMSHRDFVVFDSASFTSVGGPVRRDLTRRLNTSALSEISTVIDAENNRVGFALPLDGATIPNEVWWFSIDDGHWEMDSRSATCFMLYSGVDITTIDELVGTIDAQVGSIDSLSPSLQPREQIVYGTSAGDTLFFDNTLSRDNNADVTGVYVSPALRPVGASVSVGQRPHDMTDYDHLVVDTVNLILMDRGQTYTLSVEVSGDGGVTWVSMGSLVMNTSGGTDAAPRLVDSSISKRISLKDAVQVRLKNTTMGVNWGWTRGSVWIDLVGRKR